MRVILIHGKNTDPTQKWYPWLAKEMAARHIAFEAPILPRANEPLIEEWKAELAHLHPDQDTVLIGHSRGGVAILRWLEEQPNELKVRRVILVATNSGLSSRRVIPNETNYGFYTENGYDFAKIRQHSKDFVVLHSKDDQWVPYGHGVENANGLGAKLLSFEDSGHFGKGVDAIPELIEVILAEA